MILQIIQGFFFWNLINGLIGQSNSNKVNISLFQTFVLSSAVAGTTSSGDTGTAASLAGKIFVLPKALVSFKQSEIAK